MNPLEYIKTLLPQDEIEYIMTTRAGGTKGRKGIIVQVTDNFITVDLGRYKETVLLKDIETGKVVICNVPLTSEPQIDPPTIQPPKEEPKPSNVAWEIMWPNVTAGLEMGKTAKEIAAELGLSYDAVKSKIQKMRRKQAVSKAEGPSITTTIPTYEQVKSLSKCRRQNLC